MNTLSTVFRPMATNPPSVASDAVTAWRGQPIGPGPEVTQQTWKSQPMGTGITIDPVPTYSRTLSNDIQTR